MKNQYSIKGNVIEIQTTNNKLILVDVCHLDKLLALPVYWSVVKTVCANYTSEYARTKIKDSRGLWKTILMHNFLFKKNGHERLDHSNGNGLDNRESNIRRTSDSGNHHNKRTVSNNLKGVWRNGNGWSSKIYYNRKMIYLGQFTTPEEAHKAYVDKAKELHPELYERTTKNRSS